MLLESVLALTQLCGWSSVKSLEPHWLLAPCVGLGSKRCPQGYRGAYPKRLCVPTYVLCSLLRVFFLSNPPFSNRHFCLLTRAVKAEDLCFFQKQVLNV